MASQDKPHPLPDILASEVVAKSRLFSIEQLSLKFSNGELRLFERMKGSGRGAVMIVPMIDANTLLLIREYAAGNHSYQLGFPKGLIDPDERPEQAANRELMEEVGFGAKTLIHLHDLALAPSYFNATMSVYLAFDLYPQTLAGDEPEPLQVISWPIAQYQELLAQPDFTEARSIAALFLTKEYLEANQ